MKPNRAIASFALAAVLAGAAAAAAQPRGDIARRGTKEQLSRCIDTTFVSNWIPYDDHTILAEAGSRTYVLTTSYCPHLTDPLPQIRRVIKGGSMVCSPHDMDIYVGGAGLHNALPCFVQSIRAISPDEERAMLHHRRR